MTRQSSLRRRSARKHLPHARNCLLAMRSDGVIGDEAFHRIEEELDLAELAGAGRRGSLRKADEGQARRRPELDVLVDCGSDGPRGGAHTYRAPPKSFPFRWPAPSRLHPGAF